MSTLAHRLRALIAATGPIPLGTYMQYCLHCEDDGYYAAGARLGKDFTTAPEISQIFGELIGAWSAHEWSALGSPPLCLWMEIGPGRGLLAADALRAMRRCDGCAEACRPVLVEASPVLRREQQGYLSGCDARWHENIGQVADAPSLIVANEFLDCLPVRRFLRDQTDGLWREDMVGLNETGELQRGFGPAIPRPDGASGDEFQTTPALHGLVFSLAARFRAHSGRALFIDYGYDGAPPGDGPRAFRNGSQCDVLATPGQCDLTADVDFGLLSRLARAHGLDVCGPIRQGDFLRSLGAAERAGALAHANPDCADAIRQGCARLLDPDKMGDRFMVVCLSSPGLPPPAGF